MLKFKAIIAGGRGPTTWDNEVFVNAGSLPEAVKQLYDSIEGTDADIVSIEMVD